jgi:hypothetical protein
VVPINSGPVLPLPGTRSTPAATMPMNPAAPVAPVPPAIAPAPAPAQTSPVR